MTMLVGEGFFDAARKAPDKIAVVDGETSFTYRTLAEKARRFSVIADGMKARRVALLCDNSADFLAMWFGAVRAGAVAFVMEPKWPATTVAAMVSAHEPHVLVTSRTEPEIIAAARACGAEIIMTGELNGKLSSADPEIPMTSRATPEMPFLVVFTSGTTGTPKAVIRSHQSWIASFAVSAKHLGTDSDSRVLAPGPLSHGLSLYAAVEALCCGATVGIQRKFDVPACISALNSGAFTTLVVAPTLLDLITSGAGSAAGSVELSAARRIITAGAKLSPEVAARTHRIFPRAELIEYYGATELSFVAIANHREDCPPSSVGRACATAEIAIRDNRGHSMDRNAVGTVWVASPMLSAGYVGPHDGGGFHRDGRWATVGDQGFLDGDGYLHLAGRKGDMLITGGLNVYPSEIENVIAALPGVRACAVAGLDDPRWGSIVGVVVVPDGTVRFDPPAARISCAKYLADYKIPRRWVVTDSLPLMPSGKINRAAVAEILHSQSPS
ncbi:MAG: AMP-binding protein [Rhodobacteraceae bacterium]|nr:AMP-binding protein [Paracoccaceae bacterium]